jgi:AcrR family transcriptional regulator
MPTDTRERLVDAGADLFRLQGFAGTGIKAILAEAHAQFSSLYHHFPGGKDELAEEVIRTTGAAYQELVRATWDQADDVVLGVQSVFDGAAAVLEATDYADACPIATVALEVASTNERLRVATADVFGAWVLGATLKFTEVGVSAGEARRLALSVIALLEGSFILARATKDTEPVRAAGRTAVDAVRLVLGASGHRPDA